MTAPDSPPLHALAEDNLASASPDLLRAIIKTFADALVSAEADALCNVEYGQASDERDNHRTGYRPREWYTRVGTVELAVPKLRSGSYFPHWLLERRRRAEQALISVVATACLLGVSTRRVEKLAEFLDITQLSKSRVSAMAKHLDEQVAAFRNRPLDAGPYSFVRVDALTQKVREGGRIINVHALIAVGVNADGHREILGLDVATAEDGAGWHGDSSTNYDLLTTDFPHPDSYRAYQDELDAREPLEQDFPDHDAYRAAWEQWDAKYGVFQERKTSGAVSIQEKRLWLLDPARCHRSAPGLTVVRRPGHLRPDPSFEPGRSVRVVHGLARSRVHESGWLVNAAGRNRSGRPVAKSSPRPPMRTWSG